MVEEGAVWQGLRLSEVREESYRVMDPDKRMCEGMRALRGVRRDQLRGGQRGSRVSRCSSYRPGA